MAASPFPMTDSITREEFERLRGNGHAPESVLSTMVDSTPGEPGPEPAPARSCEACGTELTAKQGRFCSRLCAGRAGGAAFAEKASAVKAERAAQVVEQLSATADNGPAELVPASERQVRPLSPLRDDPEAPGLPTWLPADLIEGIDLAGGWRLSRR